MNNIISSFGLILPQDAMIFLTTLIFVLLAEMGDKTQLLVMAFAAKYRLRQVIIGVIISLFLLNGLAVLMGELITTVIPINYIQFLASAAFIIFGVMSFRKDDREPKKEKLIKISPILTVGLSFFVAELGDKTQLATMAFAAEYRAPFEVFTGALIGMIIADMIGLILGVTINKHFSPKYIKIISGLLFIGFGVIGLGSMMPEYRLTSILQSMALMIGIGGIVVIVFLISISNSYRRKDKNC